MTTTSGKLPLQNPNSILPKEDMLAQIQLYWIILRRSWWIILVTTITAVGIALAAAAISPKVFHSTARYIISPNGQLIDQTDLLRSLDTLDRRSVVATYAEVFGSPNIRNEAVKELGWTQDEAKGYEVSAVTVPDTNVVALSVEGPEADRAQILAITIGQLSTDFARNLYLLYDITLLDPARIPANPISPTPMRDASIAAVLGLVVGIALAVLRGSHLPSAQEV